MYCVQYMGSTAGPDLVKLTTTGFRCRKKPFPQSFLSSTQSSPKQRRRPFTPLLVQNDSVFCYPASSPSSYSSGRLFTIRERTSSSLTKTSLFWSQQYDNDVGNERSGADVGQEEEEEEEEEEPRWDTLMTRLLQNISGSIAKPLLDAVVKVVCVSVELNFSSPWKREQAHSCSSGFIIKGRRILTCAHSVDHHTHVEVKKHNSDTFYVATVLAVAPECDIAMLTIKNDKFWKDAQHLEFGDIPAPGEKLSIMGYPNGVEDVSVVSGYVSSVRMTSYLHWETKLPALQVNVSIKNGNSGGPVFNKRGKCVGMAFQSVDSTSDIIPVLVIEHFIKDYDKNGTYTGFPNLAIRWQKMKNPDLRMSKKIRPNQQGVLITEVKRNYPEFDILKPCDIILNIDGISVDNDGTVPFKWGRRIEFTYLLTQKYKGDKVFLKVLRNSEIHVFNIRLATHRQFKAANILGRPISYYIVAGFVFTTLSIPYLQCVCGWLYEYLPENLLSKALYEERVIVCEVLKDSINIGYDEEDILRNEVLTFNGEPVPNLKTLVALVECCDEEYLEFILENQKMLVLQTNIAKARTGEILRTHCIPSTMSDDLTI